MQKVHFFSKCTMARFALVALMAFVSLSALAQNKVSGTVTDKATGEPLIGVTVLEKGTSNGIATDFNGNYTISVGGGKTLVFSYIGYKTEEVEVKGSTLNVEMTEDAAMLDEVVVIGYGTMQRKDLTGSISTVNAKDLNVGIYTDPAQMLQGKVAGLSIIQSSDPNAGTTSITLRGASTLNGSTSPLYVIDGIPDADLSLIAPSDIESIDVLRDASATAIYGSKAANGVIIVTTKRGSNGPARVTYSGYVSWETSMNNLKMMTGDQLREYARQDASIVLPNDLGYNTDWQDEVLRTGFAHNHNFSISGGNEKTRYAASVNYMERDGVVRGTNMDRFIGRSLVESSMLKDHLKVTLQVNGSISNHQGVPMDKTGESVLDAMYYFSPLVPVRNEDGSWYEGTYASQNYNPLSMIY
ncbi:MAG: SusC/RagA family TonB-linked outer membrane protein, partial [Muribaculaceae bacterium]|nr:SusC/RagA family TonB-linked outer membrane protein [Muribaculaceae bacterium]